MPLLPGDPALSQNKGPAQLAWQNRPKRMPQFTGTGNNTIPPPVTPDPTGPGPTTPPTTTPPTTTPTSNPVNPSVKYQNYMNYLAQNGGAGRNLTQTSDGMALGDSGYVLPINKSSKSQGYNSNVVPKLPWDNQGAGANIDDYGVPVSDTSAAAEALRQKAKQQYADADALVQKRDDAKTNQAAWFQDTLSRSQRGQASIPYADFVRQQGNGSPQLLRDQAIGTVAPDVPEPAKPTTKLGTTSYEPEGPGGMLGPTPPGTTSYAPEGPGGMPGPTQPAPQGGGPLTDINTPSTPQLYPQPKAPGTITPGQSGPDRYPGPNPYLPPTNINTPNMPGMITPGQSGPDRPAFAGWSRHGAMRDRMRQARMGPGGINTPNTSPVGGVNTPNTPGAAAPASPKPAYI